MKFMVLDRRYDKSNHMQAFNKTDNQLKPEQGVKFFQPGKSVVYGGRYQRSPSTSMLIHYTTQQQDT